MNGRNVRFRSVVGRWSSVVGRWRAKTFNPAIRSGCRSSRTANDYGLTTNDCANAQCAGAATGGAVAGAADFVPKSTFGVAREASEAWKYAGFCLKPAHPAYRLLGNCRT